MRRSSASPCPSRARRRQAASVVEQQGAGASGCRRQVGPQACRDRGYAACRPLASGCSGGELGLRDDHLATDGTDRTDFPSAGHNLAARGDLRHSLTSHHFPRASDFGGGTIDRGFKVDGDVGGLLDDDRGVMAAAGACAAAETRRNNDPAQTASGQFCCASNPQQ